MDREILFRGKEEITGEWRYGFYVPMTGADGTVHTIWGSANDSDDDRHFRYVDPATVGQYTGLKDRNGKRIFEGDVVTGYFNHEKIVGHIVYGTDAQFYVERQGL